MQDTRTKGSSFLSFLPFFSLRKIDVDLSCWYSQVKLLWLFNYKLSKRRFVMILKNRWHCILCAREVKGHVRWTLLEINSDKIDSHGTQYSKDHVDHLRLLWSIRKQKSWTFGLSQGLCYKRYDPSASTFHFLLHLAPWAIWWPRSVCPVTFILPSSLLSHWHSWQTGHQKQGRATWLTEWMFHVQLQPASFCFLFSFIHSHVTHPSQR